MIVNIRTMSWSAQLCHDSPIVANSEITGQNPDYALRRVGKKVYFLSVGFFLQEAGSRFRQ